MGIFLVLVTLAKLASSQESSAPNMTLTVDETQAARRIAFVHEEIRVHAGPLALAYPRWIPGEHGPTGPIEQMAALQIRAGETALPWTRDPEDINTVRVTVPSGTNKVSVDFDALLENTVSDHQILLAWNTSILYPRGIDKLKLTIAPSILLPAGWKQGSSLHVVSESGARVDFAPVSLERLIDSPVLAGEFFEAVPLTSKWPAELDITGDSQASIDKADDAHAFEIFGKLVDQDQALFGFRHWQTMHFLVSQSAAVPFDGLEHEDSPYDAIGDEGLSKRDQLELFGWPLLAHEQSHSWDGKYRRPAELYSKRDYQGPERTSLLWVYEGLNEYLGMLLGTRAGFNDADYMRDCLGRAAAGFAQQTGRATTPLADTATEDWVLRTGDRSWYSLRRGQDYYDEGALIWLRADTIIREKTQNRQSLDDFVRAFLGQHDTEPIVAPYTRADVEGALAAICPYDWHNFFEDRIYKVNAQPPTDGIEAAGWRLIYNAIPNKNTFAEVLPDSTNYFAAHSIGIDLKKDGSIADVVPGTPAYKAGLGPHMTVLAVNGRVYSTNLLSEAIAHPQNGKITFVIRNFDSIETRDVEYPGGLRYPHLERIPGTHDYLSEILAPR